MQGVRLSHVLKVLSLWNAFLHAELKLKAKEQRAAIADVGCNKAYFSATALNYLAPGYGNHLQLLYKSHANRAVYAKPCGGCNECLQNPPDRIVSGQRTVDVFCFEPSEIHFVSLTQARNALYGSPDPTSKPPPHQATKVNFHIVPAAVSNASGIAHFPVNCTGNTCSLGDSNVAFQAVNVTTVDEEMRSRSVSYLDVLKIDTEGFDPAVLAGAYESLRGHRIGLLSFEYHSLWKRSGGSLRQCVRYLDDLGYTCFYDGPTLAKVTGDCWTEAYELRRWSNIVCVVRGTDMERELYSGSYLASPELKGGKLGGGKKKWGA
ncbi:hypothetical protein VOLCADRAFT_87337 [Volvox carteri f. nagariensis]|uniref:Methyltransferase FkbM domain-containing protein n=1 Tax=Volvox carteri f. nagariensis TaxID=3068 RepID=D8TL30_VOLCA|nr:uncharacterized protein VOLCADRAFT_87337 [Volvox carteri f. nagariensis]EFJ51801.1 hypothetical protein VOLCADRAFT_87337 [Volvox carteri f. nagariensis]|eukprot:XP_002947211.1 hypothetical protein VOLCADRAFT_87337 [Volvox carteri f. nagariensis]